MCSGDFLSDQLYSVRLVPTRNIQRYGRAWGMLSMSRGQVLHEFRDYPAPTVFGRILLERWTIKLLSMCPRYIRGLQCVSLPALPGRCTMWSRCFRANRVRTRNLCKSCFVGMCFVLSRSLFGCGIERMQSLSCWHALLERVPTSAVLAWNIFCW